MFPYSSFESDCSGVDKLELFAKVALLYFGVIFGGDSLSSSQAVAAGAPLVRQCTDLTRLTFEGNTIVTAAEMVTSGTVMTPPGQTITGLPEFCRVVGVSKPTADSNINFEVWLPTKTWNGKFLSVGEGGFAGIINYTRLGLDGFLDENVKRGYVTASTDTGHLASDEFWAVGHPERVVDFGYRAKHLVTVAAKGLITALYGKGPDYSYHNSCSTGGRQGLVEMQRYPNDYDGVVVGAPIAFQSNIYTYRGWMARLLAAEGVSFTAAKLSTLQAAAVAACDKLDGAADGLIEDPRKCAFDPSALLCTADDNDKCLLPAQVDTARKLYEPLTSPTTGEQVYPGYSRGGEAGWTAFTTFHVPMALSFFRGIVFEDKTWTFDKFDLEKDLVTATARGGSIMNANGTDYSAAKARGVKVMMYHGWADPLVQPEFTVQLYEKIAQANNGIDSTKDFFRLFMVPGMAHCASGPGPSSFGAAFQQIPPTRDATHDIQTALEQWVEKGIAPDQMIATKYADSAPTTKSVIATHLLCTYPQVAKYKGNGDTHDAANFTCGAP
jgi:feruloyl esterase